MSDGEGRRSAEDKDRVGLVIIVGENKGQFTSQGPITVAMSGIIKGERNK